MLVTDAIGFVGCVGLCGWLQVVDPILRGNGPLVIVASVFVTQLLARYLGFYHSIVRYLGMDLLVAGARVAVGSAIALSAFSWGAGIATQPFRLAVVYAAFCGVYLVGSRYAAQYLLIRRYRSREQVIIYGAGEAGVSLAQAMHGNHAFLPVAFVDDKPELHGKRLLGLTVHSRAEIQQLVEELNVSRVLLAIPSVSLKHRREIINSLAPLRVHVQTVPDFNDLVSGKARVDDFRDIEVEDLLSRPPVEPDVRLMQATLLEKSVLITGAGGSIGAELCRQILEVGPRRMVLFEISEAALYTIDMELRAMAQKLGLDCEIVPLLGSVQDGKRMREVMHRFSVEAVYHAAAYKHVPMVEQNIIEGICNNVFGTLRTAQAAHATKVKNFILVSTDKAVSPTGVMGASKRLAELVLQSMQTTSDSTCFAIVRFGNVLESSGSVVPRFREQIINGGPVTVTHPEIIRYFMTIPEAAQLVIQAGGMAKGGDVFVLDMGEPVKIRNLAAQMIRLMGRTVCDDTNPDGDIEIHYTGLRPAEKLYEELLIGKNATGTVHPRIMRAIEDGLDRDELNALLDELQVALDNMDRNNARAVLMRAVKEYEPENGIEDLVWLERRKPEAVSSGSGKNVVNLRAGKTQLPGTI